MRFISRIFIVSIILICLPANTLADKKPTDLSIFEQMHPERTGPPKQRNDTVILGTNPSYAEINNLLQQTAVKYGLPPQVFKAIAWKESGWQHYWASGAVKIRYEDKGYQSIGIMQILVLPSNPIYERLKSDIPFNIEVGAQYLKAAWDWNNQQNHEVGLPDDNSNLLENWYYAEAKYNGWNNPEYPQGIHNIMRSPPAPIAPYLPAVDVTLPGEAIPGFAFKDYASAFSNNTYRWYYSNGTLRGTYSATVHNWNVTTPKIHQNAGKTGLRGDWYSQWSSNAGAAMEAAQGGGAPVRFSPTPNKWIQGDIRSYKNFATRVDSITFKYKQNWSNEYFYFQVEADGKVVKTIDKHANYSEVVTLKKLNAKRIDFVFRARKKGTVPYSWYAQISNIHATLGGYSSYFSNNLEAGLSVSQATNIPIHFKINPNRPIAGHIKTTKEFATPVDTLSFNYKQNWSTEYFSFQVEADGKVVKRIDKTGPYSTRVTLRGLNAKKITFVVATKKTGSVPYNWYADVSGINVTLGGFTSYFSENVGSGLAVSQGTNIPLRFAIKPNENVVGHIKSTRTFASPVNEISFNYKQNWSNEYFSFQVEADGKVIKKINKYGNYSEKVNLKGLNAKRITFVLATKKAGHIPPSSWYADVSAFHAVMGDYDSYFSEHVGAGLDVSQKSGVPVYFSVKPNEHIIGHIKTSRTYVKPVKAISFDYKQNWHNGWFVFQVEVDGKPVKTIDKYGPYSEKVILKGLNAKNVAFVFATRKTGAVPYDWYSSISNVKTDNGQAPTGSISAPRLSTNVSKTTRFRLNWKASDPSPSLGIASYDVRYKVAGGKWRALLTNTTKKATYFKGRVGKTYSFEVRAKDKAGNIGKFSRPKRTIIPYDNGNQIRGKVGFGRTRKNTRSKYFRDTIRYSTRAGDSITYRFVGNRLYLISTKAKNRSKAKIFVDGRYIKTIDTYSSRTRYRQVVFKKAWRKRKTHTLRIVNVGNRRIFDVDGLGVGK